MNDHLVLSSSYFNLIGGRRQDSADTFRVLASLQTHSGEQAALYAVSEASTPGPMGARARRLVIDVIQGEYASRFDLAAGPRLKAAVEAAHEELRNEFQGHVRVGLTALIAEGASLYLVQVPPAQAYVLHNGNLHAVTAEPSNESLPFANALGCPGEPITSLFRDTMEESDLILLCSSWFAQNLEPQDLRNAFSAEDPDAITTTLFERARREGGRDVTCIALQAVEYETPVKTHERGRPQEESATIFDHLDEASASLSYVWQRVLSELKPQGTGAERIGPSAWKEQEPVAVLEQQEVPRAVFEPSVRERDAQLPLDVGLPEPESQELADLSDHGTEEMPIIPPEQWGDESDKTGGPGFEGEAARRGREAELDEVNSFVRNTMNLGKVTPPVQGFPDTTVAPERISPSNTRPSLSRPRRLSDSFYPKRRDGTAGGTGRRVPGATKRAGFDFASVPRAVWLWMAAGVGLVIVVIAVIVSGLGGGSGTPGKPAAFYIGRAKSHARQVGSTSDMKQRAAYLSQANAWLKKAQKHGATRQQMLAARAFVENETDFAFNVTRVDAPLANGRAKSSKGASLVAKVPGDNGVNDLRIAGGGPAVFVLEPGREQLYTIDDPSHPRPRLVGRTGDTINQVRLNDLVQLTANGNQLVAMDNQFHLFTYTPGGTGPTMVDLQQPASATHADGVSTFGGNFYILDNKAGQVWRYYQFEPSPTGYLTSPEPQLLAGTDGLAIDGDVYASMPAGKILKFSNGTQATFSMQVPFPLKHISQIYTLPGFHYLFLLDAQTSRIIEVGKAGHYHGTLQLPSSLKPSSFAVSSDGKTIYFASGRGVYRVASAG